MNSGQYTGIPPMLFKGHVDDVAMVLRVALTGRTNTPDLYEIMQTMGKSRVKTVEKVHIAGSIRKHTQIIFGYTHTFHSFYNFTYKQNVPDN